MSVSFFFSLSYGDRARASRDTRLLTTALSYSTERLRRIARRDAARARADTRRQAGRNDSSSTGQGGSIA